MAEQEVVKHTKKIYKIWNSKEHSFWHKTKEFVVEILIIVFAVSLSIWFHSWSEHRHEQKQVKTFLLGIKKDIAEDINEAKTVIQSFKESEAIYTYFYNLRKNIPPNPDTLKSMLPAINNNNFLRPNLTRFNSFSSAGKITNIEDDSLAISILELYQENLAKLKSSENYWLTTHKELQAYMMNNVKDVDDDLAQWEVLITPKGKYLSKKLIPWDQLYDRYDEFIKLGESIIKQIEEKY
jgi:hypothetical protein